MYKKQIREQVKQLQSVGGQKMRHALLAYAFVRGMPYCYVELSTRANNKPKAWEILKFVAPDLILETSDTPTEITEQLESIRSWIESPPDIEFQAHTQAMRLAYLDDKARRSQEWVDRRRRPTPPAGVLQRFADWLFG